MIKEYFKKSMNKNPIVSILILVYNAPLLTFITLLTLRRTTDVSYEVVVLDNNSKITTRFLLKILYHFGLIDKLLQSSENTYFAKGNNIASRYAHKKSKFYLLLNLDIKIIDPHWLKKLLDLHTKYNNSVSSIGVCDIDKIYCRCDGYCFLVDKPIYDKIRLDEKFPWWYGITNLQANILKQGLNITGVIDDSKYIKHYWGGSGKAYKKVLKALPNEDLETWFKDIKGKITILKDFQI